MTWLNVNDFKSTYGIAISQDLCEKAISFAEETIIKTVFIRMNYQLRGTNNIFSIPGPLMNITGDSEGMITSADIDIYEVTYGTNINQEYDLNQYVSSVVNQHTQTLLTVTTTIPTVSGRNVFADYRRGKDKTENMLIHLRRLEELLSVDWLFTNVSIEVLQQGIKQWTLNGVTVDFDFDVMQKVKESNKKLEHELWNLVRAVRLDGISPGLDYYKTQERYLHGTFWR